MKRRLHRGLIVALCGLVAAGCREDEPLTAVAPEPPVEPGEYIALAAAHNRTCAIQATGALFCWGRGVPGTGDIADSAAVSLAPRAVAGDGVYSQVAVGGGHSCALSHTGRIDCWGEGWLGQVGSGRLEYIPAPETALRNVLFEYVATGDHHTCALDTDDVAYCWGGNNHGQLGMGMTFGVGFPEPLSGAGRMMALTAGAEHTCGVALDGTAYCWGRNDSGQLGDGSTETRLLPTPVAGGLRFTRVEAGSTHSCGIAVDGSAYCWGQGGSGQLGGGALAASATPVAVAGGLRFTALAAGATHTCGVATDQRVYCWGHNRFGVLGNDGIQAPYATPQAVQSDRSFREIAAGRLHSCGLATDAWIHCWGFGGFGQLGTGSPATVHVPTPIAHVPAAQSAP
jgi:alpha-tubulin suppressor-like RCC1 family protein